MVAIANDEGIGDCIMLAECRIEWALFAVGEGGILLDAVAEFASSSESGGLTSSSIALAVVAGSEGCLGTCRCGTLAAAALAWQRCRRLYDWGCERH